jgi:tripartite-type tricarboxylate transporter receptor subunit TctC
VKLTRREWLGSATAAGAAAILPGSALADTWPARSIKAMIPFTAGSSVDVVGRIVLDQLSTQLGQAIYVENRGGAGGTIGAAMVAKAEPNGYTVLVNASAHSAAPAMYSTLPYNAVRDFAAVSNFGSVPQVVIVNANKGIKTLKELMERGKTGSISFSTAGVGSTTHWAAERLCASAGIKALHVPFRGVEALTEVVAGRVDFMCPGISAAIGFIRSGQLLPLAVCTPKRTRAMPDVPTTIEQGYPNSDYNFWNGMLVPVKTPPEIVDRLYQECTKALSNPAVLAKFAPQGIEPMPLTPKEFDALIVKEIEMNRALVKAAGLKFN